MDSIENSQHETENEPPANLELTLWRLSFIPPLY
jgi:hypothetical protein